MASWVEIANKVAVLIGTAGRVVSPDDDRPLARSIRAVWSMERQAAIREGSWNFATSRARLPALAETPAHGWAFQYQLPVGCLRVLELANRRAYDRFRQERGRLLADIAGPLDILFLADVPEPALWDALFADTFAARLAFTIGPKIAGSAFDTQRVWRLYQDGLAASKRVDAAESPPIEREESDWITARHMTSRWSGWV